MSTTEKILALHPDPNKQGTRVSKRTYDAYKHALLSVIPASVEGVKFGDLSMLVTPHLPDDVRASTSVGWWVTTVKLDLEARALIERIANTRPQRLRKPTRTT